MSPANMLVHVDLRDRFRACFYNGIDISFVLWLIPLCKFTVSFWTMWKFYFSIN